MKFFNVYKSLGSASWYLPLYKYSTGILYLYGNKHSVFYDTESDFDSFDDDLIGISYITEKQQHDVIEIIFNNDSIFKYFNA